MCLAICGDLDLITPKFREPVRDCSSRNQISQINDSFKAELEAFTVGLCFQHGETMLIRGIDFFFQNFSNRRKKNNQLDSHVGTQYFANTSRRFGSRKWKRVGVHAV